MLDKVSSLDEAKLKLIGSMLQVIQSGGVLGLDWATVAGNSVDYTYFAGVAARNPSGDTDNIDTIQYKTNGTTIHTQTFTWSATDNVTNVTGS